MLLTHNQAFIWDFELLNITSILEVVGIGVFVRKAQAKLECLHSNLALSANKSRTEEKMRLDKYLKVSRLIKRRPVANEACDAGRILVNDKVAKASLNVKPGDIIEIQFGNKNTKVEVLSVEETYKKDEAKELYRYL